ncbi:hypothetical protein CASFOL_034141 [Castilleja foliolosa]|uniref:Carboxypeptidase n=2 Tax=Castilleja foliolosa TaxID=1961234 RepID=A0ABD3BWQ6_9LAMI
MSSSFSFRINLVPITFFLFVSALATNNHNLHANIVNDETLVNKSEIVEKPFRFPSLDDDYIAYLGQHAGYVELHSSTGGRGRMFYYFFESRVQDANAPVVVWLTGGPGCSSSVALFYVNGPFKVTHDLTLVRNEYGWDKVANIIYIDQPIGTGFSYSSDPASDIPTISEGAALNLYDFMQGFFGQHPGLANNDFYITGESYAGHYIPAFAAQIHHGNKNNLGRHINLKGMAIGNGRTDSLVQYVTYPDYALNNNLINRSTYKKLQPRVANCLEKTKDVCDAGTHYNRDACILAYKYCELIRKTISKANPRLNYYDIRKNATGGPHFYDLSGIERFLNQPNVKSALGVGNIPFVLCSREVYETMRGDVMRNMAVYIPELLEDGIKLLLFDVEYDFVCNWLGNWKWVHEMEWSGRRDFNAAPLVPFIVNRTQAGMQKSHGNLMYLKVHNSGHMVSLDQPKAALKMLRRWINGHIPL